MQRSFCRQPRNTISLSFVRRTSAPVARAEAVKYVTIAAAAYKIAVGFDLPHFCVPKMAPKNLRLRPSPITTSSQQAPCLTCLGETGIGGLATVHPSAQSHCTQKPAASRDLRSRNSHSVHVRSMLNIASPQALPKRCKANRIQAGDAAIRLHTPKARPKVRTRYDGGTRRPHRLAIRPPSFHANQAAFALALDLDLGRAMREGAGRASGAAAIRREHPAQDLSWAAEMLPRIREGHRPCISTSGRDII